MKKDQTPLSQPTRFSKTKHILSIGLLALTGFLYQAPAKEISPKCHTLPSALADTLVKKNPKRKYRSFCAFINDKNKVGFRECKTFRVFIQPRYQYGSISTEGLAGVGNNGRYGFVDIRGKEVVPLKYDKIGYFKDGLAAVRLNGKWGFVDREGKEVIPLQYDHVLFFSEGYAAVKLNNQWGFIDKNGKQIIPLIYDDASSFHNGSARVTQNNISFQINTKGERIN